MGQLATSLGLGLGNLAACMSTDLLEEKEEYIIIIKIIIDAVTLLTKSKNINSQ